MEKYYNLENRTVVPIFKSMFTDFCTLDVKTGSRIQYHPQNAIMYLFTIIVNEDAKYRFNPLDINVELYNLITETIISLHVMYTSTNDKPMSEIEFNRIDRMLKLMYYLEEDILNEHKMEPLSRIDNDILHNDKLVRLEAGKKIFKNRLLDEFKTFTYPIDQKIIMIFAKQCYYGFHKFQAPIRTDPRLAFLDLLGMNDHFQELFDEITS